MSEYQYYEFQAIDKPLSGKQIDELRCYSTRAIITPTSFVNDYSWGNFKGDEDVWMEKYFDAFLYYANWGTRILKLRLPSRIIQLEVAHEYCSGESALAWKKDPNIVLTFVSQNEDADDWDEDQRQLSSFINLRNELAQGDLRALYLGWLLCTQNGEFDESEIEPPVPPGLNQPSPSQLSMIDFLRIDSNLLAIASMTSESLVNFEPALEDVFQWISKLPADDKDTMLSRLVVADDHMLLMELRQKFIKAREHSGQCFESVSAHRTVGELLQAAESYAQAQRRRKIEKQREAKARRENEAAIARAKYLEGIATQEEQVWTQIEALICRKQPKSYDEAVKLLIDLKEVACSKAKEENFSARLRQLYTNHFRKPSLLEKLRTARLHCGGLDENLPKAKTKRD